MSGNDDESSDAPRWAADEPTAMWDESALQEKGYDEVADVLAKAKGQKTAAATTRDVKGDDDSKVIASQAPAPQPSHAPARASGGPSWLLTGVIAVIAAVAVYFLVRFLR